MVPPPSPIAIVDDNLGLGRAIGRLCEVLALPFRCFGSAEEFLVSDALHDTSLLILDVQLPGLTGFELYDHLLSRGIHLPVVFVTGQDDALSRAKARAACAAAYLPKPFRANELITALRKHFPVTDLTNPIAT
jgi:FixJ family two-component response regulator